MLKWPLGTAKALIPRYVNADDAARIKAGGDEGARVNSAPAATAAAEPSPSAAAGRIGFIAALKASNQQHTLPARGFGAAAAEPRVISPREGDLVADLPVSSTQGQRPAAADAEEKVYSLDDLFQKTKAKPAIYYLPHSDEQVAKLSLKRSNGSR